MKRLIIRAISVLFFLIFIAAIVSQLGLAYIRKNEDGPLMAFTQMLLNPNLIISNPQGAFFIFLNASSLLFFIWIFYAIGKKLWKESMPKHPL